MTSTSGSQTGVVGSPAYMAPEQWRGERPDGRADLYALGVLAYELISGQRPFRDVSMQELLRLHLGAEPPALESVRKGLPPHVGRAIRRAMAKDPADRFPSATTFVAALAGDVGVDVPRAASAVRANRSPRAKRDNMRTRQWLGNALAAVMVLTAAAVGFSAWLRSARTPATSAANAPAAVPADTLAERLARELEETRKIALDAQRRAERAEATERQALAAPAQPARIGHVDVAVRGGAPRLLVDGREVAPSTPAIIDVPPGRHVVQVVETGRRYLPAQYVVDIGAGDTSKLVFADPRIASRMFPQGGQQGAQPGRAQRFNRQLSGDTALTSAGVQGNFPAPGGTAFPTETSSNPFVLPNRIWRQMSAQEQAVLRTRWERMSPQQRQRAVNDIQTRDATGAAYQRRQPALQTPARPTPP